MFRTTINASEATDVDATVRQLRSDCQAAGIGADVVNLIAYEASVTLSELVARGKQFVQMGSQISVSKKIAGDGYLINLNFGAGAQKSLWQRIKLWFQSK